MSSIHLQVAPALAVVILPPKGDCSGTARPLAVTPSGVFIVMNIFGGRDVYQGMADYDKDEGYRVEILMTVSGFNKTWVTFKRNLSLVVAETWRGECELHGDEARVKHESDY